MGVATADEESGNRCVNGRVSPVMDESSRASHLCLEGSHA